MSYFAPIVLTVMSISRFCVILIVDWLACLWLQNAPLVLWLILFGVESIMCDFMPPDGVVNKVPLPLRSDICHLSQRLNEVRDADSAVSAISIGAASATDLIVRDFLQCHRKSLKGIECGLTGQDICAQWPQ